MNCTYRSQSQTCGLVSCTIVLSFFLLFSCFLACTDDAKDNESFCVWRLLTRFFLYFSLWMKERNEELIWFACMAKNPFEGQNLRNDRSLTFCVVFFCRFGFSVQQTLRIRMSQFSSLKLSFCVTLLGSANRRFNRFTLWNESNFVRSYQTTTTMLGVEWLQIF